MYGTSGAFTGTANPGRFNYIEDLDVWPRRVWSMSPTPTTTGSRSSRPGRSQSIQLPPRSALLGSGQRPVRSPAGRRRVSSTNIFVADTGNNRIQKLDLNGNWVATYGGVAGFRPRTARSSAGPCAWLGRHRLGGRHRQQPHRASVGLTHRPRRRVRVGRLRQHAVRPPALARGVGQQALRGRHVQRPGHDLRHRWRTRHSGSCHDVHVPERGAGRAARTDQPERDGDGQRGCHGRPRRDPGPQQARRSELVAGRRHVGRVPEPDHDARHARRHVHHVELRVDPAGFRQRFLPGAG